MAFYLDIEIFLRRTAILFAALLCVSCSDPFNTGLFREDPTLSAQTGETRQPGWRFGADPDAPTAPFPEGKGRFILLDWGGRPLRVWTYAPTQADLSALPIVVVMHGVRRDADRYRDEWAALAQVNRFIVVAPEFTRRDFPEATGYNLGNVFDRNALERGEMNRIDEEAWSFSAIEPLFSAVTDYLNSMQTEYTLYGHSAGSQFVHRFLFYKHQARVKRYIAANAGWYTTPDFEEPYPYGLQDAGVDEASLRAALARDVVVLLGGLDNDAMHRSLRRTPEALRQGPHRFARGQFFFERAAQVAAELDTPFNWRLETVPYAKHSNGEMALSAATLIE